MDPMHVVPLVIVGLSVVVPLVGVYHEHRKKQKKVRKAILDSYHHWAENAVLAAAITQEQLSASSPPRLLKIGSDACSLCRTCRECSKCPLEKAGFGCNHPGSPWKHVWYATDCYVLATAVDHMRDLLLALYLKTL